MTEEPMRHLEQHGRPRAVGDISSQSADWYHEGDSRTVEFNDVEMTVRYVGRKGRRGRIVITAPPGANFRSLDREAHSA